MIFLGEILLKLQPQSHKQKISLTKVREGYKSSHIVFSLAEPKVVDVNTFGLPGSSRRANTCRPHLEDYKSPKSQSFALLLLYLFQLATIYLLPTSQKCLHSVSNQPISYHASTCPPGPCRRAPASPSPFNLTTITYKYFKVPASFFGNSYSVRQMLDCLPSTWQALD